VRALGCGIWTLLPSHPIPSHLGVGRVHTPHTPLSSQDAPPPASADAAEAATHEGAWYWVLSGIRLNSSDSDHHHHDHAENAETTESAGGGGPLFLTASIVAR